MLDVLPTLQRSRGAARVHLNRAQGGARLDRLRQSGCAKAILPRVHGAVPEVVFLNTAGGLTGGDRFSLDLSLDAGATATATTQTAERVYARRDGVAEVDVRLDVGAEAALDWLPQETIVFEDAALDRRTTVRLADGARVLMAETVVLGRAAMNETLSQVSLIDRRRIEGADGTPIFHEAVGLTADDMARHDSPAGLAGARAFATVLLAGPGAADRMNTVRTLLEDDVDAAASVAQDVFIVRLRAPDAFPLRRRMAALLTLLRDRALPRVWQT